jgi:hypothetical protein
MVAVNGSNLAVPASDTSGLKVIGRAQKTSDNTGAAYSATATYAAGAEMYDAASGECYRALQEATNKDPATMTAYWQVIPMPKIFAEYAKEAAAADMLRDDRQFEKAALQDRRAEEALDAERSKISRQAGQTRRYRAAVA